MPFEGQKLPFEFLELTVIRPLSGMLWERQLQNIPPPTGVVGFCWSSFAYPLQKIPKGIFGIVGIVGVGLVLGSAVA